MASPGGVPLAIVSLLSVSRIARIVTSRTTVAQPPTEVAIQQWLAAAALVRCLQTLDCFDYVEPRQVRSWLL